MGPSTSLKSDSHHPEGSRIHATLISEWDLEKAREGDARRPVGGSGPLPRTCEHIAELKG